MSDEKKKKKLSDLPLRLSSEIVGNEVIPIVYLGEAYRLTLDELKTFIGVISGGSVDLTKVGSHVLPKATNTYDVGNAALHWRSLYAGSVNANTIYLGNTGFSLREADDKLHLTFGSNLTEYVATESDVKALLAQLEGKADSLSVLELSQRVGSVESKANSNASKINTLSAEATTTAKGLMSAADKRLLDKLGVFYESTDSDDVINKWKELEKFLEGLKETDSLATITAELQGQIDGLWGRNSFDDLFAGHAAADTMAVGELTVDKINGGTPVTSAVLGSHLGYINGALDVLDYVSMADVNKQVSDVKSWVGTNYATGASVVTLEGRMTSFEENYVHNDFFKSYTDRIEQNEKDIAGLESNYDGFMQEFVDVARDLETRKADKSSLSNYYTKSELHNVATTGDYNDLINKPEIPSLDDVLKKNDSALVGTGLEWAAGCLRVDGDIINNASDGYTAYSWGNHASAGYAKSSELGSLAKKNSLAASDIPDLSGTYQTKITSINKLSSSLVSGLGAASGYGVSQNDFTASDGNLVVGAAVYSHVTNRLKGYATQDWVNGKNYLTGITSAQVTNALGYTPYNSTNPSGYYKSGDSPTFNTITLNGATLTLGTGVTLNDKNLAVAGSIKEGGTLLSNKYQPIGNYQPAGDYLTSANIGTAINDAIANYGFATVATSGSYNDLTNKPFIPNIDTLINDGLATRYDVAEVNAKFANYLPLSGGAMDVSAGIYNSADLNGYAAIGFNYDHNALGSPVFPTKIRSSETPELIIGDVGSYYLIHTGNIGSQSVASASTASSLANKASYLNIDANTVITTDKDVKYYSGIPNTSTNIPTANAYQNGLLALGLHGNGATAQLYFSKGKPLYYRANIDESWRKVLDDINLGDVVSDGLTFTSNLLSVNTGWLKSTVGVYTMYKNEDYTTYKLNTFGLVNNAGPYITFGASDKYQTILRTIGGEVLQVRKIFETIDSGWKTVAFTDSTVAAANSIVNSSNQTLLHQASGFITATGGLRIGNKHQYCGLYPNIKITSAGNEKDLWLYNQENLRLFGTTGVSINVSQNANIVLASSNGNVGIGTENPEAKLHVTGNVKSNGDIVVGGQIGGNDNIWRLTKVSDTLYIQAQDANGGNNGKIALCGHNANKAGKITLYSDDIYLQGNSKIDGELTISSNYAIVANRLRATDENSYINLGGYVNRAIYLQSAGGVFYSPQSGTDYALIHAGNIENYAPHKDAFQGLYDNVQSYQSQVLKLSTKVDLLEGWVEDLEGDYFEAKDSLQGQINGLWSRNSFDDLYATHVMSDTLAVEEMFTDKLTIGNAPIEYVVHEGLKLSTAIYIDGSSVALSNQLPTTTQKNNWNTAYGWGNHASAGYASLKNVDGHTFIKLSGGIESEDSWALRIGTDYFNGSAQYAVYANYGSGNVHLGTPNYRWNTVYAVTVNQSSDATLKDVIGDTSLTLSQIANAPAVEFTWKRNGLKDVGTIAQYWKEVLPEVVSGEEGSMGMNYAALGVVSAIILARNVETHEQRISRLERENEELRKEILTLKNR